MTPSGLFSSFHSSLLRFLPTFCTSWQVQWTLATFQSKSFKTTKRQKCKMKNKPTLKLKHLSLALQLDKTFNAKCRSKRPTMEDSLHLFWQSWQKRQDFSNLSKNWHLFRLKKSNQSWFLKMNSYFVGQYLKRKLLKQIKKDNRLIFRGIVLIRIHSW